MSRFQKKVLCNIRMAPQLIRVSSSLSPDKVLAPVGYGRLSQDRHRHPAQLPLHRRLSTDSHSTHLLRVLPGGASGRHVELGPGGSRWRRRSQHPTESARQ